MADKDLAAEVAELRAEIRRLADIEQIRDLQYGYWRAIDLKQPEALRDLFAPGEILIEFEDMPVWRDRDAFVQFFIDLGMDPNRQENHFGLSPAIRIEGPDDASGTWRLHMFAYNFDSRITIRISGLYDARYVRRDGRWWISQLVFRRHSLFSEQVGADGAVTAPGFGNVASDAAAHLFGEAKD
ncbi:hypothetical protein ACFB49_08200 [Sphingomonas sp. DBB INV C78]|uniref:nuclear transport factor 2 family protein n=1 Tax=Sphingomonas sp. DBB INV C78 TaxID=3349434 RepID=UPI0036D33578